MAGLGPLLELLQPAHGERARRVVGLLALVEAGDLGAQRIVDDAGRAVGRVLADLCNLINPAAIIVGGELSAAGAPLLDGIRLALDRFAQPGAAEAVEVLPGTLGERAEVLGALALVIGDTDRLRSAGLAVAARLGLRRRTGPSVGRAWLPSRARMPEVTPEETVRDLFARYEREGIEAAFDLVDDDVVLLLGPAPTASCAARRSCARRSTSCAAMASTSPPGWTRVEGRGGAAVASCTVRREGAGTLNESQQHWVLHVAGGRLRRLSTYATREEAISSLAALESIATVPGFDVAEQGSGGERTVRPAGELDIATAPQLEHALLDGRRARRRRPPRPLRPGLHRLDRAARRRARRQRRAERGLDAAPAPRAPAGPAHLRHRGHRRGAAVRGPLTATLRGARWA